MAATILPFRRRTRMTASLSASHETLVIAHRGASGYLPEHTLAGYAMAHAQEADFLEPDLVLSRDGVPVARHDLTLDETTDARRRFPLRTRRDGKRYAIDFSHAELRQLRARAPQPGRFGLDLAGLGVPSLTEIIGLTRELNRLTGRRVGLYPELKAPAFHVAQGQDLERAVLARLAAEGLLSPDADVPVMLQCFDPATLRRLRLDLGCPLPLVQLIDDSPAMMHMVSPSGLDRIAAYADAIGICRHLLEGPGRRPSTAHTLVAEAHARNLAVHVWTFRADEDADPAGTIQRFAGLHGVDGVFSDHPDLAKQALRAMRGLHTGA